MKAREETIRQAIERTKRQKLYLTQWGAVSELNMNDDHWSKESWLQLETRILRKLEAVLEKVTG